MDPQVQHFAQSLVVCEVSCMYLDTNIVTVKKATVTPLADALLSTPATSSSSKTGAGKCGSLASIVDPRGLYYRLGAVVNKTPRDGVIAAPRKVRNRKVELIQVSFVVMQKWHEYRDYNFIVHIRDRSAHLCSKRTKRKPRSY